MATPIRVRQSIRYLWDKYSAPDATDEDKKPLETLIRAWQGIQQLLPADPRSFFVLGGLHGEPFRGAGWGNASWWGGYCNHGNVLFPTWHRAYVHALEKALASIDGCKDVAMAYWDETEEYTREHGLPEILTNKYFTLDGNDIPNPLRSYTFQQYVGDNVPVDLSADIANYSKPVNYETVRFPYSGLVGTPDDVVATEKHNDQFTEKDATKMLNDNIKAWLGDKPLINSDGLKIQTHTGYKYAQCMLAPNYTVFSNITSATQWNDVRFNGAQDTGAASTSPTPSLNLPVVPLESPHNDIHLACGGFDLRPGDPNNFDIKAAEGANGDMGENDTAGFDPLFFFHHCFIDKTFHDWQVQSGNTDMLEIKDKYPGTNSVDGQGPTPGVAGNTWLTMDSPLDPFLNDDRTPMTSRDVVKIENLGYTYAEPPRATKKTLPYLTAPASSINTAPIHPAVIRISNIARNTQPGSFVIKVIDSKNRVVATESILSRWHVSGCANCQTHLNVKAHLPLLGVPHDQEGIADEYRVVVDYRKQAYKKGLSKPKDPVKEVGFIKPQGE